jgi:hypothetical protein
MAPAREYTLLTPHDVHLAVLGECLGLGGLILDGGCFRIPTRRRATEFDRVLLASLQLGLCHCQQADQD